jgi:putative oxidoreductase
VSFCYNAGESRIGEIFIARLPDQRRGSMQNLEKLRPLALLLLRLALGAIFIYHGYPKLFTHTRESMQGFVHMGFPGYFVYIAGVLEFFGGLMLVVGLFTRIAGLLLAGEMAVALWRVHGLFTAPLQVHNYELPLALAVAAFALATFGAGVVSFDQVIFSERRGPSRKSRGRD